MMSWHACNGFSDYRDLYAEVARYERSPGDEDVDRAMFEVRFWFQVDKLIEIGVERPDAEAIVDTARPTGGSQVARQDELGVRGNDPVELDTAGHIRWR